MSSISMKIQTIIALFAIMSPTVVGTTLRHANTARPSERTLAKPALQNDDAISHLKETGQYDSLLEAVKAVRANSLDDTQDVIGQSSTLRAPDGLANDFFGYSVAVSGDRVAIGAVGDDGAFANQGAAYIFKRLYPSGWDRTKIENPEPAEADNFGFSVGISGDNVIVGANQDDGPFQDQGAAYVFGMTGQFSAKLTASDARTGDYFGYSVAISGDTAIVGAHFDDNPTFSDYGSAYIFRRGAGSWNQEAKIENPLPGNSDQFGFSVAISGNTAVVGAIRDTVSVPLQGSAFVFVRSGSTWTQQARLVADLAEISDDFGSNVSISGETIVVGARRDNVTATDQGSAFVFVRNGTSWNFQTRLVASDAATSDYFGFSVSISGDVVVIGAESDDGAFLNQGSAYVFTRSGTFWSQTTKIENPTPASDDYFGLVAVSGNNIVVGSPFDTVGQQVSQGSVHYFRNLSNTWTLEARKAAPNGSAQDLLGSGVAISGDTVVIGAPQDDLTFADQGSAYVFVYTGSSWQLQANLSASDGAADDLFGRSVAIYADTIVIGAPSDDGTSLNQGSAYAFVRSGTTWTLQTKLENSEPGIDDLFGYSVDVQGDTAVIGAYFDDGTFTNQGSAFVFTRSGSAWSQQAKLTASDAANGDLFGVSVSVSGNTTIVGAFNDDESFVDQGSAYIFFRTGSTWSQQRKLVNPEPAELDSFGISVAISGETVVVGAYADDGSFNGQGSAYVFVRNITTWSQQAKLTASDAAASDGFGFSVSISGDLIAVGAFADDGQFADQGSAYAFGRSGGSWIQQTKIIASDAAANDLFGSSVAVSGDKIVVGSPYSDISVSTPLTEDSDELVPQATDQGGAYFFTNAFLAPTASAVWVGGRILNENGQPVSRAVIQLTDQSGTIRTALSSSFGYYRFEGVAAGQTYILSATHKRYQFPDSPRVLNVQNEIQDADFTAELPPGELK